MKADDKIEYEGADGEKCKDDYSHFEFLQKKVEALQEQVEIIGKILKQNEMTSLKEEYVMVPDFDDEASKKLEGEGEGE